MTSPLLGLHELGQSVWLDDLRRQYLEDGTFTALINEDGITGLTSNPAIFERAVRESVIYDMCIEEAARRGDTAVQIYEQLVIDDLRSAADLLRPCYDASGAADGYVSLEVNPHLAYNAEATSVEAKRWWARVERPNLMIKVPGTPAGLVAIRELTETGINVNVTLLFSPMRFSQVIDAYWEGLECRAGIGASIERVASVASFFVSRIDSAVDRLLDDIQPNRNTRLRGVAAVTAAASAYQTYLERLNSLRWRALADQGASPQRLLWASTGTKDPAYSAVKYIESLIAPNTVTTLPMETLIAYREHGDPRSRLLETLDQVRPMCRRLDELGIDLETVAGRLERDGVTKFVEAYDRLLARLEARRESVVGSVYASDDPSGTRN